MIFFLNAFKRNLRIFKREKYENYIPLTVNHLILLPVFFCPFCRRCFFCFASQLLKDISKWDVFLDITKKHSTNIHFTDLEMYRLSTGVIVNSTVYYWDLSMKYLFVKHFVSHSVFHTWIMKINVFEKRASLVIYRRISQNGDQYYDTPTTIIHEWCMLLNKISWILWERSNF